jgi:hypothetical protein
MGYYVPSTTLVQKVGEECVVLHMESGSYLSLDAIGTRMLDLLREYGEVETIVSTMLQEYDVAEQHLRRDLQGLLEKLVQHGLVQRIPE